MMAKLLLLFLNFSFLTKESWQHPSPRLNTNVGIVGGHEIPITEAPYMVSIEEDGDPICGGTIIHEQFILTAAHCIDTGKYRINTGVSDKTVRGVRYDVEKTLKHKKYSSHYSFNNDICLLKLKKKIEFGTKAKKVDLPAKGFEIIEGSSLETTGWGRTTAYGTRTNLLHQVTLPYVTRKECKAALEGSRVGPRMICAGESGKDSCQGDSGGPLTLNNTQVGVVSFGHGCGDTPGVYTDVASYRDWIDENIHANL